MAGELDIVREIRILEASFRNATNAILSPNLWHSADNTFRPDNWLITFPYNYSSCFNNGSLELIRKLAVINALYLVFFRREDDVLDEYHLRQYEYRGLLLKMCEAHNLRNLAVGQLLQLCGDDVYPYLFDYERKYYGALIWEKAQHSVSLENMLEEENLKWLGYKLIPLALTYAGFCVKTGTVRNLDCCESLLVHYHIARQLADDLNDLPRDITKPDKSCIILACERSLHTAVDASGVMETLIQEGFYKKILEVIADHLNKAKAYALRLNFQFFLRHIEKAEKAVASSNGLRMHRISNP